MLPLCCCGGVAEDRAVPAAAKGVVGVAGAPAGACGGGAANDGVSGNAGAAGDGGVTTIAGSTIAAKGATREVGLRPQSLNM